MSKSFCRKLSTNEESGTGVEHAAMKLAFSIVVVSAARSHVEIDDVAGWKAKFGFNLNSGEEAVHEGILNQTQHRLKPTMLKILLGMQSRISFLL